MALAETIDIVFLGALSPDEENSIGRTRFAAWYSEAYRPKDMPSDKDTMIRVVREYETKVYNLSGTHKIQWNVLIRLLHEQGVAKTAIEIRNMHHHFVHGAALSRSFYIYLAELVETAEDWGSVNRNKRSSKG
ncbi:uncharacterized protein MAM_00319 [Metarhizium album ARSEF 1941]|uniref:Uncharacterized protein n=1 Tax=Metarhizium album (strain ARSEF 1941) TaxID=1081103 RepID=A0A0B2X6F3_METAS|nr:uncharacterized protein MAM_00319 [Metarhizium album ARSEF 1941]KHO01318.1 hypothetical protein MAM_00319 [Metarhizium album ARSEF 1941]